jgi:hypothetical protein
MLNLNTNVWTDSRGKACVLGGLEQNHLENIYLLLIEIISGRKSPPNGCTQNMYELRASSILVKREIVRRYNASHAVHASDAQVITELMNRRFGNTRIVDQSEKVTTPPKSVVSVRNAQVTVLHIPDGSPVEEVIRILQTLPPRYTTFTGSVGKQYLFTTVIV